MKKIIFITIYILIGIIFVSMGPVQAPTLKEEVLTYLYVILLWPFVVGGKILLG